MVSPLAERVKRGSIEPSLVVIALGSNLGDRARHLTLGRAALKERGFPWTRASRIHETAAVGGPSGQPLYLNQVLAAEEARVSLEPGPLLAVCHEIEALAGRRRDERWGPRTLDLDIIFFGDRVATDGRPQLPHPGAASRSFVLEPLAEIAPGLVHPLLGVTVRHLASRAHGRERPG